MAKNIFGFCIGLFLVFLGLKLDGRLRWEWRWVSAPLWGPLLVVATVLAIFAIVVCVAVLVDMVRRP